MKNVLWATTSRKKTAYMEKRIRGYVNDAKNLINRVSN
jgi:hypothetical protein